MPMHRMPGRIHPTRFALRNAVTLPALALVASVFACGHSESTPQEQAASSAQSALSPAVPPPAAPVITFELAYPAGYDVTSVAVGASDELELDASDTVLSTNGSPGNITSIGSDETEIGAGSQVGNVVSVGSIEFAPSVTATSARSAHHVKLHPHDHVGTVVENASLTPLTTRSITVHAPKTAPADVDVPKGASVTLKPGRYGRIDVHRNATLTVSAGTYFVDEFRFGPADDDDHHNASRPLLHLDTSGGTVRIYSDREVQWHGDVTGDATRFIFGLLASHDGDDHEDDDEGRALVLDPGFRGTAVAPFGILALKGFDDHHAPPSVFEGTFYGKHVRVGPHVTVKELPTPWLIGGITVTKTNLCVGEETEATLSAPSATSDGSAFTSRIQGVVGAHQFVAFGGDPGPRYVFATVMGADGRADVASVPVTIQQCPPPAAAPIALHFWGARGRPDTVGLSVSTYDANNREVPMAGPATYIWTFGDGQTATTNVPVVTHDYTASINHLAPFSYFKASVAVTTAQGTATSQKVVSVWSLYAANRGKGIIQPPNVFTATASKFSLALTNYEPTPLAITAATVEQIPCDPALAVQPLPPQALAVSIPASSSGSVTLVPPPPAPGICAVGMHVLGTTAAGKVRSDAYVRVGRKNALVSQPVTDPATIALLNQAAGFAVDPNHIGESELQALANRGVISHMPPAIPPGSVYANPGDECDPADPPPAGFVCEPTPDWIAQPPEILNAFKGNFIMDHGCGNIGQLLSATGQLYSHDSIIVKNRVEVRHSTMSEDRVSDHVLILGMYVDGAALRYGYPGTDALKTHSISEMTTAYYITDPDGQTYRMGLEYNPVQNNECQGDITAVPPLVVRPDPECLPQPNLQPVVDQAMASESHYRFFMYSHAEEPQTCSGYWCTGETSTVCSLFARNSATNATLPLWPHNPDGLGTNANTDGMAHYSEDVRTAGAYAEYFITFNKVESKSWLGDYVIYPGYRDQISANIADQMTNCFASDGCDDTHDTWQDNGVGEGIAVSPDDMTKWDSCLNGGTYGYNEPAVYLGATFRHKYTLRSQPNDGALTVLVEDDQGKPISGVTAILDSVVVGVTDGSGKVQVGSVPAGPHEVEVEQYSGPPLTPVNLHPTPDQIAQLPDCPAFPMCKATSCPSGWTQDPNAQATVPTNDPDQGPGVVYEYACYPPVQPPPGCDLLTASKATTVVANQDDTVILTLCEGAACSNGVRASCAQNCLNDGDCDTNQVCSNGKCAARARRVRITDPSISAIVSGGCGCNTSPNSTASLDVTCDPLAQTNLTDWLCDGNHLQFCSSPITGGTADAALFMNGNGDCNLLLVHFVCTMDPLGTGGVIVGSHMQLQDGCSSGGEDSDDGQDWTVEIAPATSSAPITLSCDGTPSSPASGLCNGFSPSCWHDGIFACDPCCDNEADVGSAITYTSLPH